MLMKKGVKVFYVVFVLSILTVLAADLEISSLTSVSWLTLSNNIYEFSSQDGLRMDFDFSSSSLINYTIIPQGATITNMQNPSGCINNGTAIFCASQSNPKFDISVSEVLADTTFTWLVVTDDTTSGTETWELNVSVFNDAVKPTVISLFPGNYSIVKNETFTFNLGYFEEHSGLRKVNLSYDDNQIFEDDVRGSVTADTFDLECDATNCTYSFNPNTLMGLSSGKFFFDSFIALTDVAGNVNDNNLYHLYIDSVPPDVSLNTPIDGVVISTSTQNYGFDVAENTFFLASPYSSSVDCSIFIDNTKHNSSTSIGNESIVLGAYLVNLADGSHDWYVTCQDTAGLSTTTTSRSFKLDTTGPVITLTSPVNNSVIANGTLITWDVTDALSSVGTVQSSKNFAANSTQLSPYSLDTATWSGVNTLTVYADDTLGNQDANTFTFIVDTTGPIITLNGPDAGAFGNGTFRFTPDDLYSSNLNCSISINGSAQDSMLIIDATQAHGTASLVDGHYLWDVSCTDEVGHSSTSTSRTVIFDGSEPVINLTSPLGSNAYSLSNGNTNGVSNFNYTVDDDNLDRCSLYVSATKFATNGGISFNGINFSGTPQNGAFPWYVSCNDTAGNTVDSSLSYVYFDIVSPILGNVSISNPTTDGATVVWGVGEPGNNTIYYGTNKTALLLDFANGQKLVGGSGNYSNLTLTGLDAGTLYYIIVVTCDQFGYCTDNSADVNTSTFNTNVEESPPVAATSSGGGGSGSSSGETQCIDGIDNDGDGLVDLADPGCTGSNDDDETNVADSCSPLWRCTDWSACNDGEQTRRCGDWNVCGILENKPDEVQSCSLPVEEIIQEPATEESSGSQPLGVGQATGIFGRVKANWLPIASGLSLLGLLALAGWKRELIASGFSRVGKLRGSRRRKEEESIRQKLKEQGLIK